MDWWLDFYESGDECPQECLDLSDRFEYFVFAYTTCEGILNYSDPLVNKGYFGARKYADQMNKACIDPNLPGDYGYRLQPDWLRPLMSTVVSTPTTPSLTVSPATANPTNDSTNSADGEGSIDSPDVDDVAVDDQLGNEETSVVIVNGKPVVVTRRPVSSTSRPPSRTAVTSTLSDPTGSPSVTEPSNGGGTGSVKNPPKGSSPSTVSPPSGAATLSPPAGIQTTETSTSGRTGLIVGLPSVAIFSLCVLIFVVKRRRDRKSSQQKESQCDESYVALTGSQPVASQTAAPSVHEFAVGNTIPIESLEDVRIIGAGGHGVVYLVKDRANDRLLASKRLAKNHQTDERIAAFMDEVQLVSSLHHPSIVAFAGATWMHRTGMQALFEYMDGGDLRQYLDQTPVRPWEK